MANITKLPCGRSYILNLTDDEAREGSAVGYFVHHGQDKSTVIVQNGFNENLAKSVAAGILKSVLIGPDAILQAQDAILPAIPDMQKNGILPNITPSGQVYYAPPMPLPSPAKRPGPPPGLEVEDLVLRLAFTVHKLAAGHPILQDPSLKEMFRRMGKRWLGNESSSRPAKKKLPPPRKSINYKHSTGGNNSTGPEEKK